MAKYTKNELIEMVARNTNEAEIFYKAATITRTGTELNRLNLLQAAKNVTCAIMWLDKLHNEKYSEEFKNAYAFELTLDKTLAEDITLETGRKVREMIAAVNCIIKYNENYFKDEEGYL